MNIKLAENLNLITELPILSVESFHFQWKPNCHALFNMVGYVNQKLQWEPVKSYGQQIKICLEAEEAPILFHGFIVKANFMMEGETERIYLEALSASCLLDRQMDSCSFQDVHKTYGDIIIETVKNEGGQVIRTPQIDKKIGSPVIRYKETAWEFAKRLAGYLDTYIIPDVETGNHNIWFGMREGRHVPPLSEEQYTMQMRSVGNSTEIRYKVESKVRYKLGDRLLYQKNKVTITEIEANYFHGELIFTYVLNEKICKYKDNRYSSKFAGLGLWGTIKDVKRDLVKIELDIDGGKDTGTYFYSWHPDTGNALYAMPERGARALLYLYNEGGQEGAVIHCMNNHSGLSRYFKNRYLHVKEKNIDLSGEVLSISDESQGITLSDGIISIGTSTGMSLSAEGGVHLRAKKIVFSTPDEIEIYQG